MFHLSSTTPSERKNQTRLLLCFKRFTLWNGACQHGGWRQVVQVFFWLENQKAHREESGQLARSRNNRSREFRPLSRSWVSDQEEKRWRWEEERYQFTPASLQTTMEVVQRRDQEPVTQWQVQLRRGCSQDHTAASDRLAVLSQCTSEDEPLRVEAISSHPHKCLVGTSLEVQGLRLHASSSEDMGSIPGLRTESLHATWHSQKVKIFLKVPCERAVGGQGQAKSAIKSQGQQDGSTRHFPGVAVSLHRFVTAYQAELEREGRRGDGRRETGRKNPTRCTGGVGNLPGVQTHQLALLLITSSLDVCTNWCKFITCEN